MDFDQVERSYENMMWNDYERGLEECPEECEQSIWAWYKQMGKSKKEAWIHVQEWREAMNNCC